jgi:hypothetical protein
MKDEPEKRKARNRPNVLFILSPCQCVGQRGPGADNREWGRNQRIRKNCYHPVPLCAMLGELSECHKIQLTGHFRHRIRARERFGPSDGLQMGQRAQGPGSR